MGIAKKHDTFFLGIVLILVFSGFFVLSSASLGLAARENHNFYVPLLKQILMGGGLGGLLFFLTSRVYYKKWRQFSLILFLFSFLLMLLVFEPHVGFTHGGAARWLSLGFFTFQPSELLKFAFIIYLSSWLSQRQKQLTFFKTGFLPFLVIISFAGLALIFQSDLSTLIIIGLTSASLFFLAGGKLSQITAIIILGLVVFSLLVATQPYRMERIFVFFDSSHDLQGSGYQINQSKIALGSGGLWGKGFGEGLSKFNYLPEPMGDSIFAVIGEEFGFAGTSLLVILIFLFFYRSMWIARNSSDSFGRLLVSGIAILIVVQSFVNICAIIGFIPLTGVPLVFISQGGSSLALTLASIGIISNISKHS